VPCVHRGLRFEADHAALFVLVHQPSRNEHGGHLKVAYEVEVRVISLVLPQLMADGPRIQSNREPMLEQTSDSAGGGAGF